MAVERPPDLSVIPVSLPASSRSPTATRSSRTLRLRAAKPSPTKGMAAIAACSAPFSCRVSTYGSLSSRRKSSRRRRPVCDGRRPVQCISTISTRCADILLSASRFASTSSMSSARHKLARPCGSPLEAKAMSATSFCCSTPSFPVSGHHPFDRTSVFLQVRWGVYRRCVGTSMAVQTSVGAQIRPLMGG